MINKIRENVWKVNASSNIYFLDIEKRIIIDAGDRGYRSNVKTFLSKVVDFDKVEVVIFTHLHYDHIGNFDLFSNAKFYASAAAVKSFGMDPAGTVLKDDIAEKFSRINLRTVPRNFSGLKIVDTPGHTKGSMCIWYEKDKILFSGDTMFFDKKFGRTDLPTSQPKSMQKSLMKLVSFNYDVLCPGHDY